MSDLYEVRPSWTHPSVGGAVLGVGAVTGMFALAVALGAIGPLSMVAASAAAVWAPIIALGLLPLVAVVLAAIRLRRPLRIAASGPDVLLLPPTGADLRIPREGTTAWWQGRQLVLRQAEGRPQIVRVPGGAGERAQVQRILEALDLTVGPPPERESDSALASAVLVRTHDGVELGLDPVFEPLPIEGVLLLALSVGPTLWLLGMVPLVGVWGLGWIAAALVVGIPIAVVTVLWVAYELWGRQVGVIVRVTGHRIEVERLQRMRTHKRSIVLADLRSVELVGSELRLGTDHGLERIAVPDRSRRTQAALEALVDEQRLRLEDGTRGEVPAGIRDLVGRATE